MATVLKATINGVVSVIDFEAITASEYKEIRRHSGLKIGEFERALGEIAESGLEIEVIDCYFWLFLKRSGKDCSIEALPDYAPLKFIESIDLVPDASEENPDPKEESPNT